MWRTLKDIWFEIRKENFKIWIKEKRHKIALALLIIMFILIIIMIVLTINFINTLLKTNTNVLIFFGLAFLYTVGCTQPLFQNIAKKSRKFNLLLNLTSEDFKKQLKTFDYISISSIIATTAKNLSMVIVTFMFNSFLSVAKISQTEQQSINTFIYSYIALFVTIGATLAIANGYFSTDVMIGLNTDGFIQRKIKKTCKKYKK